MIGGGISGIDNEIGQFRYTKMSIPIPISIPVS